MARPVLRHRVADPGASVADDAFLDRAANAHAVEVQRRDLRSRAPAQILIIRALHHAVQRLVGLAQTRCRQPLMFLHAPAGPAERALHRILLIGPRIHQRGQLVEREHDIRANFVLDAHRNLGREPVRVTVQRRFERHAVLVHPCHAFLAFGDDVVRLHAGYIHRQRLLESDAQRHHLESARIGERRAVPIHKARQPAGCVEHILTRAFKQVEGVGQQALRAQLLHLLGQHGLHRGLRAHRYKCGRANVAVRRMDNAGAPVAGAVTPQPVRCRRQPCNRLEVESAAVAGLSSLRSQRMVQNIACHSFTLGKRARNCEELGFEGLILCFPNIYLRFKGLMPK